MEIYNETLDETIICGRLQNGLNYYIIPREMYREKRALLTVKYGSVDSTFKIGGKLYKSPLGVAHFLEHKLFDNEQGSAFDSFSSLGSYVNAYTSFNNTAYYFSCESGFEKNLETLLWFVSEPYFTASSVQKEMGIIGQEISMYDDNPAWAVYFDMLSCLYGSHPAKNSIAGTRETIEEITEQTLYKCYESFYVPENMYLICSGGFSDSELEGIVRIAERYWPEGGKRAETVLPSEGSSVNRFKSVTEMNVSSPVFQIGFKETDFSEQVSKSGVFKLTMDLFIGESSVLREMLIKSGLTDDSLSFDRVFGNGYGYASISGESKEPSKLLDVCISEARKTMAQGFSKNDFERIKKKHIGRFVRGFNSIEAVTTAAAEFAVNGSSLFDCFDSYINTGIDDCNTLLKQYFREGGFAFSILTPKGEEDES